MRRFAIHVFPLSRRWAFMNASSKTTTTKAIRSGMQFSQPNPIQMSTLRSPRQTVEKDGVSSSFGLQPLPVFEETDSGLWPSGGRKIAAAT